MSGPIGWWHPIDESDQWDGFNDSGIAHFSGDPVRHLAREAIQNAYDAAGEGIVEESWPRLVGQNFHGDKWSPAV